MMKFKEFLWPDWKKIGLFLLLSIIFLVVIVSSCSVTQGAFDEQYEECAKNAEEGVACAYIDAACIFESPLQKLIIVAIPLYLISCLIIFIYNKSRGGKRKRRP